MKFAMLVLVGMMVSCAVAGDMPTLKADQNPDSEQQLRKVEQTWSESLKARDKSALASVCSVDFLYTDDEGKVSDKAHFLEDATQNVKIVSYALHDLIIRIYGDTGIVNGAWKGVVSIDGEDKPVSLRFTDTFVRREGRWWAAASQSTRLPDEAP